MQPLESESTTVGIPAEAIYQAFLAEQNPVPYETGAAPGVVQTPAQSTPTPPARIPPGAVLLKGPHLRLAQNMEASLEIPVATSYRDVPVRVLEARRKEINQRLKEAGRSEKLSFTHLIAWALVQAGHEFPAMNSAVLHSGSETWKLVPGHLSLGLAVDVERKDGSRGLVVPVLKQADTMDFVTFLATYETLVDKARTNKLMPDDFAGATISLTNPGGLGTVASAPRLMNGQGTIIATGAIAYPAEFSAMPAETIRQLGLSKVMTMSSTYDHRVIQGAESGSYLRLTDQLLQGEHAFYEGVYSALGIGTPGPIAAAASIAIATPATTTGGVNGAHLVAAMRLVRAIRSHGHFAAELDPLGVRPSGDPRLDPAYHGLTSEIMATIPTDLLDLKVAGTNLAEALPHLQQVYCGTTAYEIEHLASHERRDWLHHAIEAGTYRQPLSAESKRWLLDQLSHAEGMEQFLHKAYLGAKRFSGEGVDSQIPMLELIKQRAADAGIGEVVVGMAHRGRLGVLAHTVGLPYETVFVEFEGGAAAEAGMIPPGGTGDVKYHLGSSRQFTAPSGATTVVTLLPNPSHLESVDAPILGHTRATQTDRATLTLSRDAALAITLHGDAAFLGQGIVAETLNMANLGGYTVGGSIHLISNNQIGFTTEPIDARSTRYSSDLAKGFDIPVIHVNADDPEHCLAVAELAFAYRQQFHADILINLVGYRRYGHNEGDEPAFTQPVMYHLIRSHPTVRQLYAEQLEREGVLSTGEADALAEQIYQKFISIQDQLKKTLAELQPSEKIAPVIPVDAELHTGVDGDHLRDLNQQLITVPDDFQPDAKLMQRVITPRGKAIEEPHGIQWGHAELLAFASLVQEGIPVRLTGQDVKRGTFASRHAVLFNTNTGAQYSPIQHLRGAGSSFEIHNSPLSELACLGYEYGYAVHAPEALVVWECQYGDFSNGAQVIIDQYITSSLSKWGETSRLTILLPHGQEGGGPEHSSARLERWLQMAAEGNIRIVNATTAAQYFHLLRRQALWSESRPLIVLTPKSMLREKLASATLDQLVTGRFELVLNDPEIGDRAAGAKSLALCNGKVYFELIHGAHNAKAQLPPLARIEQLYPFPEEAIKSLLAGYPSLSEVVWVQEEPHNMGAWQWLEPRLRRILPEGVSLRYIGRPDRASPAEGYKTSSDQAHHQILEQVLQITS